MFMQDANAEQCIVYNWWKMWSSVGDGSYLVWCWICSEALSSREMGKRKRWYENCICAGFVRRDIVALK